MANTGWRCDAIRGNRRIVSAKHPAPQKNHAEKLSQNHVPALKPFRFTREEAGQDRFLYYTSAAMPASSTHLVCTAVRPTDAAPFNPFWRSETAVAIARGIVVESAFDRLPVLADALEEAGCDDELVLRHCRECPHHHSHCWVIADLLDSPPVAGQSRMTDADVRREVERVTGQPVLQPSDAVWDTRVPLRIWFLRGVPVVVIALVLSCLGWAAISPPTSGSQFTAPVLITTKGNGSTSGR